MTAPAPEDIVERLCEAAVEFGHSSAGYDQRGSKVAKALDAAKAALLAELARLRAECARKDEALEPFVLVAERDIGEDEADEDFFRPMSKYNAAPLLKVGDFRRARAAIAEAKP